MKNIIISLILLLGLLISGCTEKSHPITPQETKKVSEPTKTPEKIPAPPEEVSLISQLGSNNYDIASYAEKKILEKGPDEIPSLIYELENNENKKIKAACARILGKTGDKLALSSLLKAIEESDETVRHEIICAIGNFKDKSSIDSLTEVMMTDSNPELRAKAAYFLGEIGDKNALWPLIEAVNDEDERVREWVAFSLGKLEDGIATGKLIILMEDDPSDKVRSNAAWALGSTGSIDRVEPLIKALKDDPAPSVRANAAYSLGTTGDVWAVEPLIKALKTDKDPQVRTNAAYSLGILKNSRAVEVLIGALEDKSPEVREQTVQALGWIGNYEAREGLKKALKDPRRKYKSSGSLFSGRDRK